MQHHVTGKWDTLVTVRKKGEEGNSYVVCAQGGNTYIRGRRLLKPINHLQYLIPSRTPATTSPKMSASEPKIQPKTTGAKEPKKPKKKKTDIADKQKMPRRSQRNHNYSRAANTAIATTLTTVHIYEFEDGETIGKAKEGGGSGSKSEKQQPDNSKHRYGHRKNNSTSIP